MDSLEKNKIIFSVDEYLEFAHTLLSQARVAVSGEILNVNERDRYTFFTLIGENGKSVLPCFVWNYVLDKLSINLIAGMQIEVLGHGSIFSKRGSFNFEVERVEIKGDGLLNEVFIKMKDRLKKEGLFDLENKRHIPKYISRLGLITSKNGQAIHDFLTHLGDWGTDIFQYHVMVEGIYAIDSIVGAIKYFNEKHVNDIDVLVISRGGGSLESLQAYNSEEIARAIQSSRIPIITAIGHDQDITIADLSADYACSTPTHAGTYIAQGWKDAKMQIDNWQKDWMYFFMRTYEKRLLRISSIEQSISKIMESLKQKITSFGPLIKINMEKNISDHSFKLSTRKDLFFVYKKQVNDTNIFRLNLLYNYGKVIKIRINDLIKQNISKSDFVIQSIKMNNPWEKLKQGYVIMKNENQKIIKKSNELITGENVKVWFVDGSRGLKSLD